MRLDVSVDDAFVAALMEVVQSRAQIQYNLVPSRANKVGDELVRQIKKGWWSYIILAYCLMKLLSSSKKTNETTEMLDRLLMQIWVPLLPR